MLYYFQLHTTTKLYFIKWEQLHYTYRHHSSFGSISKTKNSIQPFKLSKAFSMISPIVLTSNTITKCTTGPPVARKRMLWSNEHTFESKGRVALKLLCCTVRRNVRKTVNFILEKDREEQRVEKALNLHRSYINIKVVANNRTQISLRISMSRRIVYDTESAMFFSHTNSNSTSKFADKLDSYLALYIYMFMGLEKFHGDAVPI